MEKLIKDQIVKDNWQIKEGVKTAKRSWNLEGNKRWKAIVEHAFQDLKHGATWKGEKGVKYTRSELSQKVASICDNKDFVLKTSHGVVNNTGDKIEWESRSFLKPEDPPPGGLKN